MAKVNKASLPPEQVSWNSNSNVKCVGFVSEQIQFVLSNCSVEGHADFHFKLVVEADSVCFALSGLSVCTNRGTVFESRFRFLLLFFFFGGRGGEKLFSVF